MVINNLFTSTSIKLIIIYETSKKALQNVDQFSSRVPQIVIPKTVYPITMGIIKIIIKSIHDFTF